MIEICSNENLDGYLPLGGAVKVIEFDNMRQVSQDTAIKAAVNENAPRDLRPTHYIITSNRSMGIGSTLIHVLYFRRNYLD